MKIQCACGTKYAFEVTPEMARTPIRLVCQNCGQDNSTVVNELIRQQFPDSSTPPQPRPLVAPPVAIAPPPPGLRPAVPPAPVATAAPAPPPVAPPRNPVPAVRVSTGPAPSQPAVAADAATPQVCSKHAPHLTTHRCLVCQKPICPKCMEIFGFVCSAYCRGKAEDQGISLPTFAGQRDLAQSKQWRKVGLIAAGVLLLVVAGISFWIWYAWVGSVPQVAYSVRLPEAALSGQLGLATADQLVFLHGGTVARYDAKAKKEVWSTLLIDKQRIGQEAKVSLEKAKAAYDAALASGADLAGMHPPDLESVSSDLESAAAAELHLYQRGENVWIASRDKVIRYDWQNGKPTQEVSLPIPPVRTIALGDELVLLAMGPAGRTMATRLMLTTGEAKTDTIEESMVAPSLAAAALSAKGGTNSPAGTRPRGAAPAAAGTSRAGQSDNRPIDPKAVAASYQNLSTPTRLALPALAAANANQQRLQAEMRDAPPSAAATTAATAAPAPDLVPTKAGFLQIKLRLIESKMVTRKVMKDPPRQSALNGEVNASATAAVANEIFNDMQRERAGDSVQENVSRYELTLRRPGTKAVADWTGEVTGTAEVFPLQSIDVIAAGKSILVFDHNNKKLWEASLNYPVRPGPADRFGFTGVDAPYGAGPCVEHGDTLYVFDEAVLTSFELNSGNVRWRLPSIGTTGLFLDDRGVLYVNTTTATPDTVKYSRQIDVSEKVVPLVLKVEPQTGKTLWRARDEGLLSHVAGKFLYTTEAHPGQSPGGENDPLGDLKSIFEIPPHIRVRRLNASDGRVLWQHYQKRSPLDVRFERNSFQILFKKEAQVLRFVSF